MPNPYLTLVDSWKDLPPGVGWSEPHPDDGGLEIYAPLDIAGVTVGNFALRATCFEHSPDKAVMFQLETGIPGERRRQPLTRIDWNPLSNFHKNPPEGPQRIRRIITGSHHHPLEANWLEKGGRMRMSNLPVAEALNPNPANFAELLDLVGKLFRINNIGIIPGPEWSLKLVF
ncbi:hypothetical protein [Sphingopyxis microcysteis]|uniref:hypothetical protein n=1 Tax=Sphingopyxis microcysteis TaxID=2484145 RepID=UPI0014451951|nr:hypothetical protein [Sphingopyxis microcysteis]